MNEGLRILWDNDLIERINETEKETFKWKITDKGNRFLDNFRLVESIEKLKIK